MMMVLVTSMMLLYSLGEVSWYRVLPGRLGSFKWHWVENLRRGDQSLFEKILRLHHPEPFSCHSSWDARGVLWCLERY